MKVFLICCPKFSLMGPKDFNESGEEVGMVESLEYRWGKGPSLFGVKVLLPLLCKKSTEECRPSNFLLGLEERVVSSGGMSGHCGVFIDEPVGDRRNQGRTECGWNAAMCAVFGDGCYQIRAKSLAVGVVAAKEMY